MNDQKEALYPVRHVESSVLGAQSLPETAMVGFLEHSDKAGRE